MTDLTAVSAVVDNLPPCTSVDFTITVSNVVDKESLPSDPVNHLTTSESKPSQFINWLILRSHGITRTSSDEAWACYHTVITNSIQTLLLSRCTAWIKVCSHLIIIRETTPCHHGHKIVIRSDSYPWQLSGQISLQNFAKNGHVIFIECLLSNAAQFTVRKAPKFSNMDYFCEQMPEEVLNRLMTSALSS